MVSHNEIPVLDKNFDTSAALNAHLVSHLRGRGQAAPDAYGAGVSGGRSVRRSLVPGLMLSVFLGTGMPAHAATTVTQCAVLARLPHSTASYTEGFFFRDGLFYEGTGLEGHSQVLIYKPTGQVTQHWEVPAQYFGEGIIDWRDNLLEWTWQSHTGFVLDRTSLRPTGQQFHYTGEGWGITRTPTELITSDGSATLRFRNPDTFDVTRQITVKDGAQPIRNLNELEYIALPKRKAEIYANVWHSDRIARISPVDGHVIAWLDCAGLLPDAQRVNAEAVLNGIAYDSVKHRLFVTGKQWPTIFQIKLP